MKTVIYCRVGNKSQTVEVQKELCIQALDQSDELVEIFEDIGFSGIGFDRPSLLQLMEDASEEKFEKVLVYEPSRLFRDTSKILEFRNGLEQMGIELKSAKGNFEDLHISIK